MKATTKDKDGGVKEITVGDYVIEQGGDSFQFSHFPERKHVFLGVNSTGFFINSNSAVLDLEGLADYKREFQDAESTLKAIHSLLDKASSTAVSDSTIKKLPKWATCTSSRKHCPDWACIN